MSRPNRSGLNWSKGGHKEWVRLRKLKLLKMFGGCCVDCGYDGHPAALDFDHIDPRKKEGNVAHLNWSKAVREAEKCEIRCANCHRIKTTMTAQWGAK